MQVGFVTACTQPGPTRSALARNHAGPVVTAHGPIGHRWARRRVGRPVVIDQLAETVIVAIQSRRDHPITRRRHRSMPGRPWPGVGAGQDGFGKDGHQPGPARVVGPRVIIGGPCGRAAGPGCHHGPRGVRRWGDGRDGPSGCDDDGGAVGGDGAWQASARTGDTRAVWPQSGRFAALARETLADPQHGSQRP